MSLVKIALLDTIALCELLHEDLLTILLCQHRSILSECDGGHFLVPLRIEHLLGEGRLHETIIDKFHETRGHILKQDLHITLILRKIAQLALFTHVGDGHETVSNPGTLLMQTLLQDGMETILVIWIISLFVLLLLLFEIHLGNLSFSSLLSV